MSNASEKNGRATGRREQILAAALTLFAEHGVQHVSTRQLARAVGVSQPSLYAHFPTREAIAQELCRRAFARLKARMEAAFATPGTPEARLRRAGHEYVAFGLEEPAAYRVAFMLERVGMDEKDGASTLAAGLEAFATLLVFFREVRGDAGPATDVVAQSCWAAKHGLVALMLSRPAFPWADREALVEHHLTMICRAALGVAPPLRGRGG